MIIQAERKQGILLFPGKNETKDILKFSGKGVFVSMYVTKQGGINDLTQVALYLDRRNIVSITFAAARSFGLNKPNNSGIFLSEGTINALSVQFNEPLSYSKELRVEIKTGTEFNINKMIANVIIGKNCSYPDQ